MKFSLIVMAVLSLASIAHADDPKNQANYVCPCGAQGWGPAASDNSTPAVPKPAVPAPADVAPAES